MESSQVGFAGYIQNSCSGHRGGSRHNRTEYVVGAPGSSFGTASTWIGVQNPAGLFVQIGITETGFGRYELDRRPPPLFEAFWSDTERGFHPVNIGQVETGDRISLEMTFKQRVDPSGRRPDVRLGP